MISIEPFRGSAEELAGFVNAVWEADYAGKMPFPRVTVDYFNWQFRRSTERPSPNLLTAYDGDTPAGVLLGTDYPVRTPDGVLPGSIWSWLSVAADYRGRKLSKELDRARVETLRDAGGRLIVSYRYFGSRHSLAERPERSSERDKFHRKIGLWARVIDPKRFCAWHLNPVQRALTQLSRPFLRTPKFPKSKLNVRPYEAGDLADCLRLVESSFASTTLAIAWDEFTLAHQLAGGDVVETLVAEDDGRITGLVNFHLLPYQARTVEPVGCIDLLAFGTMSTPTRVRLLNAALARMRERGAIFAVKLRCGDASGWPMMRTNFVPMPADSHLVFQWVDEPTAIPRKAKLHLLWR